MTLPHFKSLYCSDSPFKSNCFQEQLIYFSVSILFSKFLRDNQGLSLNSLTKFVRRNHERKLTKMPTLKKIMPERVTENVILLYVRNCLNENSELVSYGNVFWSGPEFSYARYVFLCNDPLYCSTRCYIIHETFNDISIYLLSNRERSSVWLFPPGVGPGGESALRCISDWARRCEDLFFEFKVSV